MKANHLTKNAMSHKLVLLAAAIAIAIIAAFSVCLTTQARAYTKDVVKNDYEWTISGRGGEIYVDEGPLNSFIYLGEWSNGDNVWDYIDEGLNDEVFIAQDNQVSGESSLLLKFTGDDEISYKFVQKYDGSAIWTSSLWDIPESNYPWTGKYYTEWDVDPVFICKVQMNEFNISGHVANADDVWQAVPGAFVQYCQWNPWFWDYVPVPEMSAFTDWFGNYTIEGVTEDMLPGVIRVYRWGYEVGESAPIWFVPDGLDTIYRFVEMTPVHHIDLADVEINGGPHHVNFVTTYELVKDGKVVESDGGTFNKIEYKVPVGSSYAVYDDGTLHCSYAFDENGTSSSVAYTVKAIAEEGYVLDKWNINGEDLVPGKDYILRADDVMGLASYKLAEQPVPPVPPTPGPTPVNPGGGTAQTGDATPFAAVAMIAIVAALGCGIALRKEY